MFGTYLEPNRIDKLVKRRTSTGEELRYNDTFAAVDEREHLADENVSQRHHEVVKGIVYEY